MIIYIAGPITGVFNYRNMFLRAEKKLTTKGHIVINPSYLPNGLSDYMPICKAMLDQSDAVYFINGFDKSIGALEEFDYAKLNKIAMFFEDKPSFS